MNWIKLYTEQSIDRTQTLHVTLDTKELKLIQNYLDGGKPLNDPQNRECMDVVVRILQQMVDDSGIENISIDVSAKLNEILGVKVDIDPYGENTGIELSGNGLIELKDCHNPDFNVDGKYADMVEGGFWDEGGELTNGFISVDSINEILEDEDIDGVPVSLEVQGKMAKVILHL